MLMYNIINEQDGLWWMNYLEEIGYPFDPNTKWTDVWLWLEKEHGILCGFERIQDPIEQSRDIMAVVYFKRSATVKVGEYMGLPEALRESVKYAIKSWFPRNKSKNITEEREKILNNNADKL